MAEEQSIAVEYRDIPGLPGYRVGSDGSLWSCWERFHTPDVVGFQSRMTDTWKRLNVRSVRGSGYLFAKLHGKCRQIHHLVLLAFVGPRPNGMLACHNDGVKTNNAAANLRWDTPSANCADTLLHGTKITCERHGMSKLTVEKVTELRTDRKNGIGITELSRKYGVCASTVKRIVARKLWASVP